MKTRKSRRGRLRNELFLGLAAVVLTASLSTYVIVLSTSIKGFDSMVGQNDVEIAKSYAAALAVYFEKTGSWDGAADYIHSEIRPFPATGETDASQGRQFAEPRDESPHPRGGELPLILFDRVGTLVYNGFAKPDGETETEAAADLKMSMGEKILVGDETAPETAGYVFFKSMIVRSYDPKEAAFITTLRTSVGVSVALGLILALLLSGLITSRLARPVSSLEKAVRNIGEGDLSTRVEVTRTDEIGSLAEGFNRMADRLEATETARQNLLADLAHELRTPVSVIQANLEMIIDGVYKADAERMNALYDETRILAELISDLRSLSDLETGYFTSSPERINLLDLAAETRSKLAAQFAGKGITVEIEGDQEEQVLADAVRLGQVLRNLLGNALKYAPENSTVTVTLERITEGAGANAETGTGIHAAAGHSAGPAVRVTVADQGPGVPPDSLDKIFDRFYRVDPSRNRESGGRGLGLAICRRIVEDHGGTIGARNREPSGLEVYFELPATQAGTPGVSSPGTLPGAAAGSTTA